MKKVYVTRNIPGPGLDMLKNYGCEITVNTKDRVLSKRELIKELKRGEYDVVLSLLTDTIDAEVLDVAPRVRLIANYAVGFNNIDVAECARRGVLVTNTPGTPETMSESVAEHTWALIFALAKHIPQADLFTKKGKYKGWNPSLFIGTQLHGLTLGLIGAGSIGERVAHIGRHGFGMNVVYYDVKPNESIERNAQGKRIDSIEILLPQADIVSLHVPLLDSTRHLINEARLRLMKKSAILINTARGPVVDEKALITALRLGTISGAGLDVFENEPKLAAGLSKLPNLVLTPHIASATDISRNEMSRLAAQNIIDFCDGKTPQNLVKNP